MVTARADNEYMYTIQKLLVKYCIKTITNRTIHLPA